MNQVAKVIFNFDDGLRTVMEWHGAYRKPITIFVCPEWLELPGDKIKRVVPKCFPAEYKRPNSFLTWDMCGDLIEQGCEIGCHTYRHRDVSTISEDLLSRDVSACKKLFAKRLGQDIELFAFPWHRVKHAAIVRKHFPRIRTVYGRGRLNCGLITMLVWHSGRSTQLKQWTESLLAQDIQFTTLGAQSDLSPFFATVEETNG